MRNTLTLIICISTLIFSFGCQDKKTKDSSNKNTPSKISKAILATINGDKISIKDYQQYLQQITLAYAQLRGTPEGEKHLDKLQQELLGELIDKRIMLKESKRLKLEVSPVELKQETEKILNDYPEGSFESILKHEGVTLAQWQQYLTEELLIKKLITNEVEKKVTITEEDITEYFYGHTKEFERPERVRVRQIVLEDELEAEKLWKKLRRGKNFDKLAETHSLSPEGAKGGDLGYFARGEMPAEFEEVAFNLKRKNEVSKVFSTSYGFHIFQLIDRQKAHQATLDEVKSEIQEKLRQQKVEIAFSSWLAKLKSQAKIKINPYFNKKS